MIVVTNQSGIGRSIFAETDMHEIHAEIQSRLKGDIDAFYFCPHLPDAGCLCRKPRYWNDRRCSSRISTSTSREAG